MTTLDLSLGLLQMQKEQHAHDKRNHCDIQSLHKGERLKHYGLHFCKYAGRIARGVDEAKPFHRTVIDAGLVCLSAANTLTLRLDEAVEVLELSAQVDPLLPFVDAAGRFADACEKFDHLEDFALQAKKANADICAWVLYIANVRNIDLAAGIKSRRKELANRAFYAQE